MNLNASRKAQPFMTTILIFCPPELNSQRNIQYQILPVLMCQRSGHLSQKMHGLEAKGMAKLSTGPRRWSPSQQFNFGHQVREKDDLERICHSAPSQSETAPFKRGFDFIIWRLWADICTCFWKQRPHLSRKQWEDLLRLDSTSFTHPWAH